MANQPFSMSIPTAFSLSIINKTLAGMPEEVQVRAIDEGLFQAGKVVETKARALAPVKSGNLRKTVKRQSRRKSGRRFTNVIAGNNKTRAEKGVFYSHFVQFGTARQRAQPFLLRAAEQTKDQVLRAVAQYVRSPGLQNAVDAAKAKSGAR